MISKIIQLLHLLLVIGIILSIFITNINIKQIFFTLLIFLFMQHIINYGKCGLTELEYIIKGEKYFNNYLYILHIIWIIILGYQLDYLK
jgi:hypothetical protein